MAAKKATKTVKAVKVNRPRNGVQFSQSELFEQIKHLETREPSYGQGRL